MQLSPAAVEQREGLSDPKHERDVMDVVMLCDTVWKMGGEKGVNISGIGPHGPSLAEYQASKWLHMEERRVLEENALAGDSAYSPEEIIRRGFEERGYNNRLSKPLYKTSLGSSNIDSVFCKASKPSEERLQRLAQ